MSQFDEEKNNHKMVNKPIPSEVWGSFEVDESKLRENYFNIKEKVAHYNSKIIAVTKYYGLSSILKGFEVGLRDFGESRANDAIAKIESLPDDIRQGSSFHFIGHLQSNKVKKVVKYFDCIQSVDSLKLAEEISTCACAINKRESVSLQVNNAKEEQKSGYSKEILLKEFDKIIALPNLEVIGLMNIAPFGATESELRFLFSDMRKFKEELEQQFGKKLPELSMGMSDDFEIALQEGATMVRIGRKVFK